MASQFSSQTTLRETVKQCLVRHDCSLWGIEIESTRAQGLVRIYIEASAVTIDLCAQVYRDLSDVLYGEGLIAQRTRIEVSSPGVARRFFYLEQLSAYLGAVLRVKPLAGETLVARLRAVAAETLVLAPVEARLDKGEEERVLLWSDLRTVSLHPKYALTARPAVESAPSKASGNAMGALVGF